MTFEVKHIRGIEEIQLQFVWHDENGKFRKKGLIIEINPDDLEEVYEGAHFPRIFLSKEAIREFRV